MSSRTPIDFLGDTLDKIKAFPLTIKKLIGYQLDLIQQGLDPDDWKPMKSIGKGVREIRIREKSGAYRIIYITKSGDKIYVLHCFQKKTQKTRQADLELAQKRLREIDGTSGI